MPTEIAGAGDHLESREIAKPQRSNLIEDEFYSLLDKASPEEALFTISVVQYSRDHDVNAIFSFLYRELWATASSEMNSGLEGMARVVKQGRHSELKVIVDNAINRMDSSSEARSALKIANAFTLGKYADKGVEWWKTEYKTSMIAGIYDFLPTEEWMSAKIDSRVLSVQIWKK